MTIIRFSFFVVMLCLCLPQLQAEADVTGAQPETAAAAPTEGAEATQETIAVKNGKAKVGGLQLPVFAGVQTVDKSSFDGVRYILTENDPTAALAKAKKIKAFYAGKKVGKTSFGKFKKFGPPHRHAWYASGKADKKRPMVAIMVNENEITIHVMPHGDSDTLALLL